MPPVVPPIRFTAAAAPTAPTAPVRGAVTYDGTPGRGLFAYGAGMVDTGEYVPELLEPRERIREYERRSSRTHLASLDTATRLPIQRFPAYVDQGKASDAMTELVSGYFGLPVGIDGEQPAQEEGSLDWDAYLDLALDAPIKFGHAYWEFQAGRREFGAHAGRFWFNAFEPRPQNTLIGYTPARDGSLVELEQQGFNDPRPQSLLRDHLVAHVHRPRPGDWWGKPILRDVYEQDYFREMFQVQLAETIEKGGVGVLHLGWDGEGEPDGDAIAEADWAIANWKDHGGLRTPKGFTAQILSPSGNVDALSALKHSEQKISAAFMASVMELGTTGQGNRALGDTFEELWFAFLISIAGGVAKRTNVEMVRRLVTWNEGPQAPMPSIRFDYGDDPTPTVTEIKDAAAAGLLDIDEDIVAQTRKRLGFTQARPGAATRVAPTPVPAPDSATTAVTAAAAPDDSFNREPSAVEITAAVDFKALAEQWRTGARRLADKVAAERLTIGQKLAGQIADLIAKGDLKGAADIAPPAVGVALMSAGFTSAVQSGAKGHVAEAVAQGAPKVKPTLAAAEATASSLAEATGALIGSELKQAVLSKALNAAGPSATSSSVASVVAAHVATLSDASVFQRVASGVVSSTGEGRAAAMAKVAEVAAGRYLASELMDSSTCDACAAIDGEEYATLEDALADYPSGAQYINCEGGSNCRGVLVAVYDETAPTLSEPGD